MSLLERAQKCLRCAGRGLDRAATHGNACDDCWRAQLKANLMHRAPAEEKTVGSGRGVKRDIDWSKVQAERSAGATTTSLAEKHGVSTPTICAHTHAVKGNGKRAGRKVRSETTSGAANGVTHEGMQLAEIVAALKKQRDALNVAIEALT